MSLNFLQASTFFLDYACNTHACHQRYIVFCIINFYALPFKSILARWTTTFFPERHRVPAITSLLWLEHHHVLSKMCLYVGPFYLRLLIYLMAFFMVLKKNPSSSKNSFQQLSCHNKINPWDWGVPLSSRDWSSPSC